MKRIALLVAAAAALGGAASDEPVRLGIPGAANSGVSLAASGSDVAVAWAAVANGATDVFLARSRDGGLSFGEPLRVNDAAGDARVNGEQAPRVAFGRGIEVAWLSKKGVRAATLAKDASSFEAARTVHDPSLAGARGWHSLAVDTGGAVHVAWLDGRNNEGRMRQDLFQIVRRPDGSQAEAHVAQDVCFCCKTSTAAGPDGTVYVAWRHIYPTNLRDIAVARSSDGGKTFGAPVRVSEDGWQIAGCPDDGPSLAVDAKGGVHVAWPTVADGKKAVFYSQSGDGSSFAPRVRVDDGATAAGHPVLAVSKNRVAIVWDESGQQRRILMREVAAGKPGPVNVLSSSDRPIYPAIAATATSWVVAWSEPAATGSEIRLRRLPVSID